MNCVSEKFQNISLRFKIQGLIVLSVFFISVISFAGIGFMLSAYNATLYDSVSSSLSYSASIISERLDQTENLADMIFSDHLIQNRLALLRSSGLRSEQAIYKTEIYNQLTNYFSSLDDGIYDYLSYFAITQDDTMLSTKMFKTESLPADVYQALSETALSDSGRTLWVTDYAETYGLFLVKTIREIDRLSLEPLGILIINIDSESLVSSASVFSDDDAGTLFLLTDGNAEICRSPNLDSHDAEILRKNVENPYAIVSLSDGKKFFSVRRNLPNRKWDSVAAVSYDSITHTVALVRRLCLTAILLSLLFVLISSNRILSMLTKHFDVLIDKMNRFGKGDYSAAPDDSVYARRTDEIGKLHNHFNQMAVQINTLIEENYVNELLKKEAQIKAMESQMDPHFLYNTLDSVNWRAKAAGAEDISQITTALGSLLRISLSGQPATFTLQQELDLVENYMKIQELRYPRRLQYRIDLPEEYFPVPIPKFTIQPLLENAIRYGLEENMDVCLITVRAFLHEEGLCIEIKNSGSSFDEFLLEKLEKKEVSPHGFGIGLLNIHKRLKIAYGGSYGLRLFNLTDESTGEEYAVAQILLPVNDSLKKE